MLHFLNTGKFNFCIPKLIAAAEQEIMKLGLVSEKSFNFKKR
jgi:hypothetical protein